MPLNLFAFRSLFMGQKTMTKSVYLKFKCFGDGKVLRRTFWGPFEDIRQVNK